MATEVGGTKTYKVVEDESKKSSMYWTCSLSVGNGTSRGSSAGIHCQRYLCSLQTFARAIMYWIRWDTMHMVCLLNNIPFKPGQHPAITTVNNWQRYTVEQLDKMVFIRLGPWGSYLWTGCITGLNGLSRKCSTASIAIHVEKADTYQWTDCSFSRRRNKRAGRGMVKNWALQKNGKQERKGTAGSADELPYRFLRWNYG